LCISNRSVATVAAPLLQACSSLAFTLALHTCCSSLALTCPGQDSLIYHSTATCVGCPPTHSFCLRWQIILEYKTTDADKCAVRPLQPCFLHMRSLRVGAFVPVCGCFHQLSTSSHASPSIHSTRPQWSIYCACLYGAQRGEMLILIFLTLTF
jgi:hypothetical protein